jgi:hypothetical protein
MAGAAPNKKGTALEHTCPRAVPLPLIGPLLL